MLPRGWAPLPCRGEGHSAAGSERDLVLSATSSLQAGQWEDECCGWRSPWHFQQRCFPACTFRSSLPDVSSECHLLVEAEGMDIIALAKTTCSGLCSVLHVCCYQWSQLPFSCPSPELSVSPTSECFAKSSLLLQLKRPVLCGGGHSHPGQPQQSWD